MRAIAYHQHGRADQLVDITLPDPTPQGRDLLVRIEAVSVNPVDTKVRASRPVEDGAPQVLGYDAVGTVEALGADVSGFRVGDRVWYAGAIDRPGTNSELHLVDHRIVGRAPATIDPVDAAALPLTSLTAWELLFDRLAVATGSGDGGDPDTLLVVGGAGGVGSALIQLARTRTDLRIVATASRPETISWARAMGAHLVIDHHAGIAAELRRAGVGAVRYVAALTHTDHHLDDLVEVVAPQGAIAVIDDPEHLDIVPLKAKSVAVHWELMFTRSLYDTTDVARQGHILSTMADLVDDGTIRSTVVQRLGPIDAANLRAAHELVEGGTTHGKAVLAGWPTP